MCFKILLMQFLLASIIIVLLKINMIVSSNQTYNKLLKRKNNGWPSLRDYSQPLFFA